MLRNAAGLFDWFSLGGGSGCCSTLGPAVTMTKASSAQVLVHRVLDLFDRQRLDFAHEVFQVGQRQAVEADTAELADDIGVTGGGQRETAGDLALAALQLGLGRPSAR